MIVYIVTSGEYSDYGIETVFSTRQKAQDYIDLHGNKYNYYIEEYEVDDVKIESKERGTLYEIEFNISYDKNHKKHCCMKDLIIHSNRIKQNNTCKANVYGNRHRAICYIWIEGDDDDFKQSKATKIAQDMYAKEMEKYLFD